MESSAERRALQLSQAPSVPARIDGHAHEAPHATAISFNGQDMDWEAFAELVRYCAKSLKERGVGQGDRVALLLTNRPEFLIITSAAAAIGAISVPINFRLSA
ncbi:MAG TPA: AMP-binding protein, partial [Enteractinococcus sp.]